MSSPCLELYGTAVVPAIEIFEPCVLRQESQLHRADGALALLADDEVGLDELLVRLSGVAIGTAVSVKVNSKSAWLT